jgi:hypothetical protein
MLQLRHGDAVLQADANNRSELRSNLFLSASLVAGPAALPVRVRNLSPHGALVDGGSLPPAGASVRLVRGDLSAEGEIAWQTGGQAGMRFAGEIDVSLWVKRTDHPGRQRVGHPGQQRVDNAIAALRTHEPTPRDANNAEPASLARISAELDEICERLAGSPAMTVELGEELMKLDALARALQQRVSRG